MSFTPCVYPVMPITASFIGGFNASGSRWMGFLISIVYVFGMALTYCALAVFAALSGKVFGQVQNSPWIALLIGLILFFFALVMLEIIPLGTLGVNIQPRHKPRHLGMVIVFGMACGLAVGPCTAPVLGTLLVYVASQQNILHGVSLLFVFSYGVGASLILVGTFSGLLVRLPKSGTWLRRVKQICALVLLSAAAYFLFKFLYYLTIP